MSKPAPFKNLNMEYTNYQMWQLEKYGNIAELIYKNGDVFENGAEEMERLAEWVEMQSEREIEEKIY